MRPTVNRVGLVISSTADYVGRLSRRQMAGRALKVVSRSRLKTNGHYLFSLAPYDANNRLRV